MNREELFIKCVAPAISSNQQLASNIRSNQHANRGPRGRLAGAGAEPPEPGASLAAGPRAECMHAPAGHPLVQRRRPRPPAPYGTHAPGLAIIFLYGLQGPCSAPGRTRKLLVSGEVLDRAPKLCVCFPKITLFPLYCELSQKC